MKTRKRFLSLLLAICLVVGLMPTVVFAAGTDTGKAIQLVDSVNTTGGISGYDSTNGYDYIYYGNWTAPDTFTTSGPIKWRVLDDQTNTGGNGLFLLSDAVFGEGSNSFNGDVYFDKTSPKSNAWQGSDAQAWCKDFAGIEGDSVTAAFSAAELSAILETTKSDKEFKSNSGGKWMFAASENILNRDKVFFLSAEEAENSEYGFDKDEDRIAYCHGTETPKTWWLRSPIADNTFLAGAVSYYGNVGYDRVGGGWAARPAFNLNLDSVLFTSAAEGGKSASGMDSGLAAVGDYGGNEWKLTLKDSSRSFVISDAEISGNTIKFSYSNAKTGTNEYISAVIEDNGEITHYGRISQLDGTTNGVSGTASLTLPDGVTLNDTVKLYVFNEQCNGDYKTDYASDFQDISLAVTLPPETMPKASFTATGDNGGTLSNVEPGMKYSTDGGTKWNDVTGTSMELTGVTAANDVLVKRPGNGSTTSDSAVQTIAITQAETPTGIGKTDCTTTAQNDGTITNVNNTMEYKLSTASEWISISGNTVAGLENGTYAVRVRANGTVLASVPATVTIGAHTCVAQGEWQYNADEHWKLCACDAKVSQALHQWENGACTVCGAEQPSPPPAPTVQKPEIITDTGAEVDLSILGTIAAITVDEDYELVDVTLNGVSLGKVTTVTGLKTGDKLIITTRKKLTEEEKELIAAVEGAVIDVSTVLGDGYIRVNWKTGGDTEMDHYEIYRADKKDGDYGDSPYFTTKHGRLSGWYKNTKELEKGTGYFYKMRGVKTINGENYYTPWSDIGSCTYKAIGKGVRNTTIKASSTVGAGYIRVQWRKSAGYSVDYYEVFRTTKKGSWSEEAYFITKQGGMTGWYKNTKELKKGTRYYYKVRGVRELDGKKIYTKWSTLAYRIAR